MTQLSLRTLGLPEFTRHAIGFDRLFHDMEKTFANTRTDNYPPYNIVKLDETHYMIEVAVAGFAEDEIDVELKESILIIKGAQAKHETEAEYVHRGISSRSFERTFTLADNVEVRNASVRNGVLSVGLEHVVPEEQKPKKIQITFQK
jgi:molecular chaperone IbpA